MAGAIRGDRSRSTVEIRDAWLGFPGDRFNNRFPGCVGVGERVDWQSAKVTCLDQTLQRLRWPLLVRRVLFDAFAQRVQVQLQNLLTSAADHVSVNRNRDPQENGERNCSCPKIYVCSTKGRLQRGFGNP